MSCGIRAALRRIFKHFPKSHKPAESDLAGARCVPTAQESRDHVHTSTTSRPTAASHTGTLTTHHSRTNNVRVPRNASELRISPSQVNRGGSRLHGKAPTAGSTAAMLGESKPAYLNRMPLTGGNNRISALIRSEPQSHAVATMSTETNMVVAGTAQSIHSHDDAFLPLSKPSYLQGMPPRSEASQGVQSTAGSPTARTTEHQGLPTPPNEIDDVRGLTRDGTSIMIITPPSTAGSSINGKATAAHLSSVFENTGNPVQQTEDITNANLAPPTLPTNTGNIQGSSTGTPPSKGCRYFPSICASSPPSTPPRGGTRCLAPRPNTPCFPRKTTSNTRFVKTSMDPLLLDAYRSTMPEYTRQPGLRRNSKVPGTPNRSTRMAPTTPGFNPRMTPLWHIKHRDAATMSFRRFVGHNRKKTGLTNDDFIRSGKCCDLDVAKDTPEAVLGAGESSDEDDEYTAFYESLTRWTKADKKKCLLAKFNLKTGPESPTARLAARAAERYSSETGEAGGSHSGSEEDEDQEESVWEQDWDTSAEMTECDSGGIEDAADSGEEEDGGWEGDWDSDGERAEDGEGVNV